MENFGIASVVAITVICYLIGLAVKATNVDNKYIPVVVGFFGAVLGVAGLYVMPDYPANDVINAIAIGIVSGLASTGVNEIKKIGEL